MGRKREKVARTLRLFAVSVKSTWVIFWRSVLSSIKWGEILERRTSGFSVAVKFLISSKSIAWYIESLFRHLLQLKQVSDICTNKKTTFRLLTQVNFQDWHSSQALRPRTGRPSRCPMTTSWKLKKKTFLNYSRSSAGVSFKKMSSCVPWQQQNFPTRCRCRCSTASPAGWRMCGMRSGSAV